MTVATKMYVDAMMTGVRWYADKPTLPDVGDCYVDHITGDGYMYDGWKWIIFTSNGSSAPPPFVPPSQEQLDKHPALKEAWEEFLVIKKLLGV